MEETNMENVESSLNVISRKKICSEIGVSRDTLKLWIKDRNFPEPLKSSGREPLFKLTEVKSGSRKENKMDSEKWKSVAVPIKTWTMLKELSEESDRSIGGQISFLTKQEYLFKRSITKQIDKLQVRG
jgi:predicted DNA-binding transcriptional regulator AlpA